MNYARATGQQIVGRGGANDAARQSVGWGPVMARAWGWGGGYPGGYPWARSPAGYWPYSDPWGYAPGSFEPSGFVPWYLTAGDEAQPPPHPHHHHHHHHPQNGAPHPGAAAGWAPPAWALPALGGAMFGAVVQNWMHGRAQPARRAAPSAAAAGPMWGYGTGARAMWGYGAGQAPPPPRLDRRAPPPPRMNTWKQWQRVHPGTPYSDYRNWWSQFGQQGATISGDQFHGAGYGTGARAMWGY